MKLTTGYKKPIASSGTDAQEQSSNNSYLLLAGGGHKALSELVSPADLTTELSNYVTIGSNQTITGVKTFSQIINADISGNADTVDGEHAVAFAHIGSHNNLTVDNEFTFASSGFSGDIWFNYRTAGGANGNITDYIFGNGKGGQLYSLNTIATNASTAYSWGNHANVGYLLRSDIGSQSVNYATNAGNAGTLNGHTADDFVLKTTHDVYESVIVESLNDLDNRKIEISDLPTSLPANGGHAATATNVDWSGITNKPSSFPANGGNADTINGYSSSDFVLNTNYGEFKSVVATALNDLDRRKIEASDIPTSLPASDVYDWAKAASKPSYSFSEITPGVVTIGDGENRLLFRTNANWASGVYYSGPGNESLVFANINPITSWIFANANPTANTDWRYLTPSLQIKNGRVTINKLIASDTDASYNLDINGSANATTLYENGMRVSISGHTHTKSEITDFPTIGNGRLILKNGDTIINDKFTANKSDDTTIDLKEFFATSHEINTLGNRIDKIDTSITELNTAIRVDNPFDDSGEDDEDTIESNDDVFGDNVVGNISLRFYGITSEITTYVDLHVHWVNIAKICDISEVGNSISSLYNIRITIDLTGTTIASTVGISSDTFKQFYIRGANINNHICGFDVRGNGTTNTATAIKSGKYLLLNCQLKLHGDKSDIGSFIMEEAKNGNFKAYLCLRQTI